MGGTAPQKHAPFSAVDEHATRRALLAACVARPRAAASSCSGERLFGGIPLVTICGKEDQKHESAVSNACARAPSESMRLAGERLESRVPCTTAAQCRIHGGADAAGKNAPPLWRRIGRELGHARAAGATGTDDAPSQQQQGTRNGVWRSNK